MLKAQELEEADFESHPTPVIPDEFVDCGSFWWYAHVTYFLLQVRGCDALLPPVEAAGRGGEEDGGRERRERRAGRQGGRGGRAGRVGKGRESVGETARVEIEGPSERR